MSKGKNYRKSPKISHNQSTTKILGWEVSEAYKKKLITWTIEGLIISAITFAILWLPLFIK